MAARNYNVMIHRAAIKQLRRGEMCRPRFATLQTSNRCNQRCRGCSYGGLLDGQIMSRELHKMILGDMVDLGVRGFEFCGGGEPLCLPYIAELWQYLIDEGCNIGLITNGVLLTDELMAMMVKHGTFVRVSLEASNAEDYQQYKRTRPDDWAVVLDNIRRLVELRGQYGANCQVSVKFAVSKSLCGLKHFQDGIDLGRTLGVDGVQFKAIRHEPEELDGLAKQAQEQYFQEADKRGIDVSAWIIPEPFVPQCWLSPLHTVVDHLGDVYLCCYYYHRPEAHRLGNLLEESMEDMWYSDRHWDMIKKIDRRKCSEVDCKFFRHHQVADEAFCNGRDNYL